jgi:hypothetical protein
MMPAYLEDVRIKQLPSTAYYVSDFITIEEEQTLLKKVGFVQDLLIFVLTHRKDRDNPKAAMETALPSQTSDVAI